MPTEREMRAMNQQQAMAAIPQMTLAELREAQKYPINSSALAAIQREVHKREAEDAARRSGRTETWRYGIATGIALLALVVSLVALWAALR